MHSPICTSFVYFLFITSLSTNSFFCISASTYLDLQFSFNLGLVPFHFLIFLSNSFSAFLFGRSCLVLY
ncbi:hypothetical protein DFH28DRAFT_947639 [Melampsora americana]|nr:hypothetical protein DFH28DRAFT_947639 [Melampsora americana]